MIDQRVDYFGHLQQQKITYIKQKQIYKIGSKFCQILNKTSKNCLRL